MRQIKLKDLQQNQYCLLLSSQGEGVCVFQHLDNKTEDKWGLELYNLVTHSTEYHHYQYNDDEQSTCLLLKRQEALTILSIQGVLHCE